MGKTPVTAAEIEAAIGRRGEITVTADNRALVRRWFVTQGLPALFVGGLSMRELALAYNDTKGEQFSMACSPASHRLGEWRGEPALARRAGLQPSNECATATADILRTRGSAESFGGASSH